MLGWILLLDATAATLSVPSVEYPTLQIAVDKAVAGDVIEVSVLGTFSADPVVVAKSIDIVGLGTAVEIPSLLIDGASVSVNLDNLSPRAITYVPTAYDTHEATLVDTCVKAASTINGDETSTTDLEAPPALCVIGAKVFAERISLSTAGYGILALGADVEVHGLVASGRSLPSVLASGWNGTPGVVRLVSPSLQKHANRAIEVEGTKLLLQDGKLATNGLKLDGADINATDADVTIDGTILYARTYTTSDWGPALGGAVRTSGGSLTVRNASFSSYRAGAGGAIFSSGTGLRIEDSVFAWNASSGGGGALYAGDADVTIARTRFCDNSTAGLTGGAVQAKLGDKGVLDVRNSVFVANVARQGAAIATPEVAEPGASQVRVWNNTFWGNVGESEISADVAVGAGTVEFVNNLAVGTSAGLGVRAATSLWNDFDLYFGYAQPVVDLGRSVATGANDLVGVDPLLVAPGGCDGDYDLQADSAAIDAGDGVDTDGSAADIGAYTGHRRGGDTGIDDTDAVDTDAADTDAVDTDAADTDRVDPGGDAATWLSGGGGCATATARPPPAFWAILALFTALSLVTRHRRRT